MWTALRFGLAAVLFSSGCARSFTADNAQTRLVFAVGDESAPVEAAQLEAVRAVVAQRVEAHPLTKNFIVETGPRNALVVLTPKLTESQIAAVRDLVTRPGTLELALLANARDHAALIAAAQSAAANDPVGEQSGTAWIPLHLKADGQPIDLVDDGMIAVRDVEHDGRIEKQVLVVLEAPKFRLTEKLLKGAQRERSFHDGVPALGFTWNEQGGYLMTRMTGNALPAADGFKRRLGIILDGRLHSAPAINDRIGGRGIIEGDFTEDEVERLVISLNAGRLPQPVRFVEAEEVEQK